MKRTSLWAIVDIRAVKRGIVRARARRVVVVLVGGDEEEDEEEEEREEGVLVVVKALHQPTTANGRDVVRSKGSPSVR